MPHVRLLVPVTQGPVTGTAGDVIRVDAGTAHDLTEAGRAVLVRSDERRTAVRHPDETA